MWVIHDTNKLVEVTHSEIRTEKCPEKNLRALRLIDWASRNPSVKPKLCETQKWVKLMKEAHSEIWTEKCLEKNLRALRLLVWASEKPKER